MKYTLLALGLILAGCDAPVPRDDVPRGITVAALKDTNRLPVNETDPTDPTDPTGGPTGPACDTTVCGSGSGCSAYSDACNRGVCTGGCCESVPRVGYTQCSNGCCNPQFGTCGCDSAGVPTITCSDGYANCDNDTTNGCEVANVPTSCGPSCTNCTTAQHIDGIGCTSGACSYGACQTGWGNCDTNLSNGCETSTLTTVAHCGECNHACTAPEHASPVCNAGTCDFVCANGFMRCGDQCKVCCGDSDCKSPPTRCDQGVCMDGTCMYKPKSCLVRDCYGTPDCNDATGECEATPLTGGSCGNNLCVSGSGTCQDGICVGAVAKDCSAGVPLCKVGRCDQLDGSCAYEDQADGTPCIPSDKCYEPGLCIAGACNGTKKVCPDPGVCKAPICNQATGECGAVSLVEGSPCTMNDPCRQNEACDGNGHCTGTMLVDGTPCDKTCGSGEIALCSSGACGCTTPSDMAIIDEENTDVDLGTTGKDKGKGCSTVGGESPSLYSVVALVFWAGLLLALRRPRARLVKYSRPRRR